MVKVIINALITRMNKVLFVKYANMPDEQSGYLLPSSIAPHGSNVVEIRDEIIASQLGVHGLRLDLKDADSFIGRDKSWHVALTYVGELNESEISPAPYLVEHRWLELPHLEGQLIAHSGWTRSIIARSLGLS